MLRSITLLDTSALAEIHAACFPAPWDAAAFDALLRTGAFGYAIYEGDDADVQHMKEGAFNRARRGAQRGVWGGFLGARSAKIYAFVLLRTAATETEILTLATHPSHQRRGLARALLAHSCTTLAEAGGEEIFLEVREDNLAAQMLYLAQGFTQVALRPDYYATAEGRKAARVLRKSIALTIER